jgi:UDP:flavonoid glycosyltransferase YjiC (YdhE family)
MGHHGCLAAPQSTAWVEAGRRRREASTVSSVLITCCATPGHVDPACAIASDLVQRGHRVRILTGPRYRQRVRSTGADFVELPPEGDVDLDHYADELPPGRPAGVRGVGFDLEHLFLRPMAAQYESVRAALDAEHTDVVITELLFTGTYPLAAEPRDQRPLVALLGISPLSVRGGGTGPYGLGLRPGGPLRALRNHLVRTVSSTVIFGDAERYLAEEFRRLSGVDAPGWLFDLPLATDAVLQLGPPGLEYPRPGLPMHVDFVGPLPITPRGLAKPSWWSDLDGGHPVVHVTQGTVANDDFGRLVAPTVRALADQPVLVVLTAGGRPEEEVRGVLERSLGGIPHNVRTAGFLDYSEFLPRVDVLVTNGGFGTVTQALAHGVPLVVAGRSQDKAEVAARVAWSGAGIDLRTATPTQRQLARAVGRVLSDPRYRMAARRLEAECRSGDGLDRIDALVRSAAPSAPGAGAGAPHHPGAH